MSFLALKNSTIVSQTAIFALKNSILTMLNEFLEQSKFRTRVFQAKLWCGNPEKLLFPNCAEKVVTQKIFSHDVEVNRGAQPWRLLTLVDWEGAPQGH